MTVRPTAAGGTPVTAKTGGTPGNAGTNGAAVTVRPAQPADSPAVFAWRNDPATRAASRTPDPVPWSAHDAWFADVLTDPDRHLLVGSVDGEPVGVVRFDRRDDGRWEVSVNLAPAARGRRLATPLLRAAAGWLHRVEPPADVVAEIRADNAPSRRAFTAAGYTEVATVDGWSAYLLPAVGAPS